MPGLKQAVIAKFKRDNGFDYAGADPGVVRRQAELLQPGPGDPGPGRRGDHPAPYWVSYPDMSILAGGEPVLVHAGADQHFKITPAQLRGALTDKTRLVVINSPSNPTGMAYTADELARTRRGAARVPEGRDRQRRHVRAHPLESRRAVRQHPQRLPRPGRPHLVLNGVSRPIR